MRPRAQPRIEEPVSGRAAHGPSAGDHGAREQLIVDDDCSPACEICIRQTGVGLPDGACDRMAVRRLVQAWSDAGVEGIVLS